jgi:hypothetical protein
MRQHKSLSIMSTTCFSARTAPCSTHAHLQTARCHTQPSRMKQTQVETLKYQPPFETVDDSADFKRISHVLLIHFMLHVTYCIYISGRQAAKELIETPQTSRPQVATVGLF